MLSVTRNVYKEKCNAKHCDTHSNILGKYIKIERITVGFLATVI